VDRRNIALGDHRHRIRNRSQPARSRIDRAGAKRGGLSHNWSAYPETVVSAIDGILVVIILLDIAHTVFGHMRTSVFPVRPFLVIGILAGVRDILSASARLTLSGTLSKAEFNDTLIALGVGWGWSCSLVRLVLLRFSGHTDEGEREDRGEGAVQ